MTQSDVQIVETQLASCGNARDTSHSPTSLDILDQSNLPKQNRALMVDLVAFSTFGGAESEVKDLDEFKEKMNAMERGLSLSGF